MGKIYVIIGKSASGKDHIYQSILKDSGLNLKKIVSYTTRPKRENEENGREYFFSDKEQLDELKKQGKIIEERIYNTVYGPWHYFMVDDGRIQIDKNDYLTIGTIESFVSMKDYFGKDVICPVYIEVDDGIRLIRAVKREQKQINPGYNEVCRRFLADSEDFSEEKIKEAGIEKRFSNNGSIEECIDEIKSYINSFDMRE